MIVLVNCFMSLSISNAATNSSTGGVVADSISNDSIAIDNLKLRIDNVQRDCDRRVGKLKKQRNIAGGIGIGAIILLIISIL